jgi:hypothetical protein
MPAEVAAGWGKMAELLDQVGPGVVVPAEKIRQME